MCLDGEGGKPLPAGHEVGDGFLVPQGLCCVPDLMALRNDPRASDLRSAHENAPRLEPGGEMVISHFLVGDFLNVIHVPFAAFQCVGKLFRCIF